MASRPVVIGITTDLIEVNGIERILAGSAYANAVARAGGVPVLMAPDVGLVPAYLRVMDGFVLTGGDDPRMEPFGSTTDPRVTPVRNERQAFESALLEALGHGEKAPVLGVCLGMQMMALHAAGVLDQWMPDSTQDHASHWERDHPVSGCHPCLPASGTVRSKHRQRITDPGRYTVAATAPDGTIEAIVDPDHPFRLGVQWHPERTGDSELGQALFNRLVSSAGVKRC
ncbi:MAG: gamma-glutamyl-gamma-aminobutyrate hydrolase family protein [Phycisphaerales bacterium]